ncbi:MAG: hypothetical protein ACRDPY_48290 [Streptosporangiaceae bacterium]
METLLIVAMLIVGVAVLYVAATLSLRTRQGIAPLVDGGVTKMSAELEATAAELRGQLQSIAAELRRDREQARLEERKIQGRLDHADRQIVNMSEQFSAELAALRRLGEQVAARQDQSAGDPRQPDHQPDHQAGVAEAPPPARSMDWAAAPVFPPPRAVPEPPRDPADTDPDWPADPGLRRPGPW